MKNSYQYMYFLIMNKQLNILQLFMLLMSLFFIYPLSSQTPSASFATWKDNKKAAYTIIHDDFSDYVTGIYDYADPIATARGIKLCFGAITNFCGSREWAKARTMLAHGHECINHTHNHKCGGNATECSGQETYNSADFATELDLSTQLIETNTGVRPRFFIHPYDVFSTDIITRLTNLGYVGTRGGNRSTLNPSTFTDFMHLNYHVFTPNSDIATLNQVVDQAISSGRYAVREFHGVGDGSWSALSVADYTNHLNYVKAKIDSGFLWSATATEAIYYKMLRDAYQTQTTYSSATGDITVNFNNIQTIDAKILSNPITLNISLNGLTGNYYLTQNNATIPSTRSGSILTANIYLNRGQVIAKATIIPVELTQFKAALDESKQQVFLNWTTATERQNDYFAIERQGEGDKQFQEIERIKGSVNSDKELNYNWIDKNPKNGVSYYRLKQMDLDGHFSYSKTVSIDFEKKLRIQILPNFTEGPVYIVTNDKQIENVFIWNHLGQLILETKQNQVDLSAFPNGLYIVQVKTGGKLFVEKIKKL